MKASFSFCNVNGNEATKSPIAGVGSPMNEVVCLSSMLNLARRSSANTAKKKATNGRMLKSAISRRHRSDVSTTLKLGRDKSLPTIIH